MFFDDGFIKHSLFLENESIFETFCNLENKIQNSTISYLISWFKISYPLSCNYWCIYPNG